MYKTMLNTNKNRNTQETIEPLKYQIKIVHYCMKLKNLSG